MKSVRARKGHSVYGKKIGKTRKHSARFIGHKLQLTALDCTFCPGSEITCQEENQSQLHRELLRGVLRAGMASGNGDPLQDLQAASHASLPSSANDIMGIRPEITCYQRH